MQRCLSGLATRAGHRRPKAASLRILWLCMVALVATATHCATAGDAGGGRTLPPTKGPDGAGGAPRGSAAPDNGRPTSPPSAALVVTPITVGNFTLGKDGAPIRLHPALGKGAGPAGEPVCVFASTDLRFELLPSAGGAELISATLSKLPACLTLFNNGNGQKGAEGLSVSKYDAQGKPRSGFKGFWWDIDATEAGRWRGICATAVFRHGNSQNALTEEVRTNTVLGATEIVSKLQERALSGCTIIESNEAEGRFTILFQQDVEVAEVLYIADTTFGILKGQISWQVGKNTVPVVGPRLVTKMKRGEAHMTVQAWGDAPNILDGQETGGPGPRWNKRCD
jgi:hypothetical protein